MFLHPLITWTDENSVNISIIDDQHRGIIGIINTLHFFIQKNQADYYLNTIFSMVYNYTKVHFATEEQLMRDIEYPDYKAHKVLHDNLVRESFSVANASMRYKDPDIYLEFLESWWMGHIKEKDVLYAHFIKINNPGMIKKWPA